MVKHDLARTSVRIAALQPPQPLQVWCEDHGVSEALNGGFFTKPDLLPRVAIGLSANAIIAVAADGRAPEDDGLTLVDLATFMLELGVSSAINLDGGSSSALITAGVRRNCPRDDEGTLLDRGYPTPSTIIFEPKEDQDARPDSGLRKRHCR